MTTQLALPGLATLDPLTAARDDLRRVTADWEAAQDRYRDGRHEADWPAIVALAPEYFRLLILVDRLESGRVKWWH